MPFTISHVAAVLPVHRPLARLRLFSAAVIGAMVPDFGLFLPIPFFRWQTHSLIGLFTFCLPVGLFAYWLAELLLRPALLEILPNGAYARLRAAPAGPSIERPRDWLAVIVVLLGGAVTHLIWDGFTHENTRGVRMFPVLLDYGPDVNGHPMTVYHWLQYGSSVVGLLIVLAALGVWLSHAHAPTPAPERRLTPGERRAWIAGYCVVPLLAVTAAFGRLLLLSSMPVSTGAKLSVLAIAGMRGSGLSLILVSTLLRLRLAPSPRAQS